jgi:hypothetical protein
VDIEETRARASHALADVRPLDAATVLPESEVHPLSPQDFPVPELIRFGLQHLRDLKSSGPAEKVQWWITAQFGDIPFEVSLQKFGLRLSVPKGLSAEAREVLVRRLKTAASLSELHLRDVAQQQIAAGNVTIENQYRYFDGAYRFFRDQARVAYDSPKPEPRVTHRNAKGEPSGWVSEPWKPLIEGGYLAGAMVDAYFSRLEHLLVLVLPFGLFAPENGALVRFVGLTWDDKWREVFDLTNDMAAKRHYDQLRYIKESIRNPLSHGGFKKMGTSFFFHVAGIGALPALLNEQTRSFEFFFTRVPPAGYDEVCSQLDAIDAFMAASSIAAGVKYAQAGLDVAFSAAFRDECRMAAQSEEALLEFIDHQAYLADLHANMDY